MKTLRLGGILFSLYETKGKTWKAYTRIGGKSCVFHRKTKADAITAAKAFADGEVTPLPERVTIERKQAEIFFEAEKILEPFGINILDAARSYAQTYGTVIERVRIHEIATRCLEAKFKDGRSKRYLLNFA